MGQKKGFGLERNAQGTGAGERRTRRWAPAVTLPVIHVEASELLVALALQEARVRAEIDGALRERVRRMRTREDR